MEYDSMRTFLITEIRGNAPTEVVVATDDIFIRKEIGRFITFDTSNVVFATFANLFKAIGFDISVVPVHVLNTGDDVRHWTIDHDPSDVIPNTRRITIE